MLYVDVMSLLQSIELVEGILKKHRVSRVRDLPWNESAVSALKYAGFKPRTVMQIWQNIAQIAETMADSGIPMGKERPRTDKWYGTLMLLAFWEGFHMQVMMRGVTGRYASPVWWRVEYRQDNAGIFSSVPTTPEKGHHRRKSHLAVAHADSG